MIGCLGPYDRLSRSRSKAGRNVRCGRQCTLVENVSWQGMYVGGECTLPRNVRRHFIILKRRGRAYSSSLQGDISAGQDSI